MNERSTHMGRDWMLMRIDIRTDSYTKSAQIRMFPFFFLTITRGLAHSAGSTGTIIPSHWTRSSSRSTACCIANWTGIGGQHFGVAPSFKLITASWPDTVPKLLANTAENSAGNIGLGLWIALTLENNEFQSNFSFNSQFRPSNAWLPPFITTIFSVTIWLP